MRISALCLCALLLAACGEDAPEPAFVDENTAIDTITQQALSDHLAYLADDAREGRMAGERGYDEAAQYVADRFAECHHVRDDTVQFEGPEGGADAAEPCLHLVGNHKPSPAPHRVVRRGQHPRGRDHLARTPR